MVTGDGGEGCLRAVAAAKVSPLGAFWDISPIPAQFSILDFQA